MYGNLPLYQISVILKNFRFWDIFDPKYEWKEFWKNKHQNVNKHMTIYLCTKFQSIWRTSDFGTKVAPKIWMKRILKEKKLNSKEVCGNLPLYQISVILEDVRFWDQICQKNMNKRNFEIINAKAKIRIYNVPLDIVSFKLANGYFCGTIFSQRKYERQKFWKKKH